jgi:hypothetical protein
MAGRYKNNVLAARRECKDAGKLRLGLIFTKNEEIKSIYKKRIREGLVGQNIA